MKKITKEEIIEFDKTMMIFSQIVYRKEEIPLPDDYTFLIKSENPKFGFYAESYYKNGQLIIVIRGTDDTEDWKFSNKNMGFKEQIPSQFNEALEFYNSVLEYCKENNITVNNIVITGHSLGGSLAQLLGYFTKTTAVTFNAYGTANLLKDIPDIIFLKPISEVYNNIRNYGNINDAVFYLNIDNHIGQVYIIDTNINETFPRALIYHFLDTMGDISFSVPYNSSVHKKFGTYTIKMVIYKELEILEVKAAKKIINKAIKYAPLPAKLILKPTVKLLYNNYDVTRDFTPYIQSITYRDFLEDECDELSIVLNDYDKLFQNSWYPDTGAKLSCVFEMGNEKLNCGTFTIFSNCFNFSKYGDTVEIVALATPLNDAFNTKRTDFFEKTTLENIAQTIGDKYGFKVLTNDTPFKIERINQVQETDFGFLKRISKDYGYIFKITDNLLTFITMDDKKPLFTIKKENTKLVDIKDTTVESGCEISYFNPVKKKLVKVSSGNNKGDVIKLNRKIYSIEESQRITDSILKNAQKEKTGRIKLKEAKGNFISGVDFNLSDYGVYDGIYRITSSTHTISENGWEVSGTFSV